MSLIKSLYDRCQNNPAQVILSQLAKAEASAAEDRETLDWTGEKFLGEVDALRRYLQSLELPEQERVAIISSTRAEWLIADFAVMANYGVSVSVYQTLTTEEIGFILHDSGATVVFAENQEQVDKLAALSGLQITIPEIEDRPAYQTEVELTKIIAFEQVDCEHPAVVQYATALAENHGGQPLPCPKIEHNALASFVYTSGTTGVPKGVVQTHGNHQANISQVMLSGILADQPSLFVFLPLAHSFAKLMAYLGLLTDCTLKLPAVHDQKTSKLNPELLKNDMVASAAGIYPIVPRILEKVHTALIAKSRGEGLAAKILKGTIYTAEHRATEKLSALTYPLFAPVRKKIKQQVFGKNFRFVVSGGAKLNDDTNLFFEQLGICILQGYGLTETCVATNINRQQNNKIGTVGPVLADSIAVRIAEDGEILFKGPNIAQGYWNRPEDTNKSWDSDGWFATGDLGSVDEQGYLSITGRKKEIIVTSYGKKIAPLPIEAQLQRLPLIETAVMHGSDRKYCIALLMLDKGILKAKFKGDRTINDFNQDPAVRELLDTEIAKINAKIAGYEQIKKYILLTEAPSIENGLLTPTLKIKRGVLFEQMADEIDALYSD